MTHHDLGTLPATTAVRTVLVWDPTPTRDHPAGQFVQRPMDVLEVDLGGSPALAEGDSLSFSYEVES